MPVQPDVPETHASPLRCMSVAGATHAVLVTVVLVTKCRDAVLQCFEPVCTLQDWATDGAEQG